MKDHPGSICVPGALSGILQTQQEQVHLRRAGESGRPGVTLNFNSHHLSNFRQGTQLLCISLCMLVTQPCGEGNGNPLQCSCLENPVDRGAWRAAVHGIAQSQTRQKQLSMHACIGEGNGNLLQYSPGESQGRGSLVGCRLCGRTESDTTEAT